MTNFTRLGRTGLILIGLGVLAIGILGVAVASVIVPLTLDLFFGHCRQLSSHEIGSNSLPVALRWQIELADPIIYAPNAADGMVFVTTFPSGCIPRPTTPNKLVAVDAVTGEKRWESAFHGLSTYQIPLVKNGIVVIPINLGMGLRGIEQTTGKTLWEMQFPPYRGPVWSLVGDNQTIYAGLGVTPVSVFAVSLQTGEILWDQSGSFPARSGTGLVLENGQVKFLSSKAIYVLNSLNGKIEDQYQANLDTVWDQFSTNDSTIYLVPPEAVSAVDLASGKPRWTFSPECMKPRSGNEGKASRASIRFFIHAPIGDKGSVYSTGGCHAVFALDDSDGSEKWKYENGGVDSISQLAPLEDVGYVMFSDWSVRALNLGTGEELGRLETQSNNSHEWDVDTQGLDAYRGMLYATFGDRMLYAFGE